MVTLGAGHLRAAEATGAHHLHALRASPHGLAERLLHRAPEGDALLELPRHVIASRLSIKPETLSRLLRSLADELERDGEMQLWLNAWLLEAGVGLVEGQREAIAGVVSARTITPEV